MVVGINEYDFVQQIELEFPTLGVLVDDSNLNVSIFVGHCVLVESSVVNVDKDSLLSAFLFSWPCTDDGDENVDYRYVSSFWVQSSADWPLISFAIVVAFV